MSNFGPVIFGIIATSFVLSVIILCIAIFQDTKTVGRAKAISTAFIYMFSVMSILAATGGFVFLSFIGLRATVFQDAFYTSSTTVATNPPQLYYAFSGTKPDEPLQDACNASATKCNLTDSNRKDIDTWVAQFTDWQKNGGTAAQTRRDLVSALTVLVIAVPLAVIFLWLLKRHEKRDGNHTNIEPVYYYGLSFIGLVSLAIALGVLVNVGFKSWLIPDATHNKFLGDTPVTVQTDVDKLVTCADVCDLSPATVQAAKDWRTETDRILQKQQTVNQFADDYATTLPLLAFSALIFGYHLFISRRLTKHGHTA